MDNHDKITRETRVRGIRDVDILVVSATAFEGEWSGCDSPYGEREIAGMKVACLVSGPGQVNTALALGKVLGFVYPRLILSVGVGGAYPSSGLSVGDIAVATCEVDADWGVEAGSEEEMPGPLSIPRLVAENRDWQGVFPVTGGHAENLLTVAKDKYTAKAGVFVSSSLVTTSVKRAISLETLYGGICENMEGAAAAHAALTAGCPFAEVRGISNIVGPRDIKAWSLKEAAAAAGSVAGSFIELLDINTL